MAHRFYRSVLVRKLETNKYKKVCGKLQLAVPETVYLKAVDRVGCRLLGLRRTE